MRRFAFMAACVVFVGLTGCHSHYIQTTVKNTGSTDLSVVQVDYPSASFGVQHLAPGAVFHYRFKLLGSGNLKLTYMDGHRGEHTQTGPWLNEGQEGTLEIDVPAMGQATFHTSVTP